MGERLTWWLETSCVSSRTRGLDHPSIHRPSLATRVEMPENELKRIFLSYGRADAPDLADKIANDLRHHTLQDHVRYDAWKDRVDIKSGLPWAEQVVDALRDVAGVVAILSPHAVRTRQGAATADSVCLDEIAYARFAAKKPIVPVMAIQCEPPFEIFRLDYVDFTSWKDHESYRVGFSKLLESIGAALRGETRYRRWDDRLHPWDFDSFLASKRGDFVGRTSLFTKIREWIGDSEAEPTLLIVGEPGIGKSALVAELVHRNFDGRVLAYHCCQATAPETLRPGRFVRSVAAMIASRHPAYETLIEQSPYRDVLIEARCGRDTIVGLLARHIDRMPQWLKIVATSRPEPAVLDALAGLKCHHLDAQDQDNLEDLAGYIRDRIARTPLAQKLAASGHDQAWAVMALGAVAKGNFLYARQALDGIATNALGFDDVGKLPPGLSGQFQWFFERQFGTGERWSLVRPLFESLVAAREPIGSRELQAGTGLPADSDLPRAIDAAASYLRTTQDEPPRHELYHRSLLEWLTDTKRAGKAFAVSTAAGHTRLAKGLLAQYRADSLNPSPYTLAHLPTHLAEAAASAPPFDRVGLQSSLAAYVLDPFMHQQRVEEPFGLNAGLALALETLVAGPPRESAPLAFELALGWQAFRRDRLDARRLFELARQGRLDGFERELQLYAADEQWIAAARLVAAWLSLDANVTAADQLRRQARSGTALDERIDAAFEQRAAAFERITDQADPQAVADIFNHVGGTDAEPVNPSMLWDQAEPPPSGERLDHEGVRYLAEFHAPVLVAFAQVDPEFGSQRVRDYVALSAANAYREYRNGSLWQVLRAVARHSDASWVRTMVPPIVEAALAGAGRDFTRATHLTLLVLRAAVDTLSRAALEEEQRRLISEAQHLMPQRGRGDSWAEYRRSMGAIAEARQSVLDEDVFGLLQQALALPQAYAGFQAPACLTLAESLLLCDAPVDRIDRALADARSAAQNVQDLVFCARTVSRVTALTEWWRRPPPNDAQLVQLVDRFHANPRSMEFCTVHTIGETYPERRIVNTTSRLPVWLLSARTLTDLARVYQWPLADFLAVNSTYSADTDLASGTRVHVPDPKWSPMLAAYLAALVARAPALTQEGQERLILKLVARAAENATALDTVLARLLIVLKPTDGTSLAQLEHVLSKFSPLTSAGAAGGQKQ